MVLCAVPAGSTLPQSSAINGPTSRAVEPAAVAAAAAPLRTLRRALLLAAASPPDIADLLPQLQACSPEELGARYQTLVPSIALQVAADMGLPRREVHRLEAVLLRCGDAALSPLAASLQGHPAELQALAAAARNRTGNSSWAPACCSTCGPPAGLTSRIAPVCWLRAATVHH